MKTCVIGIFALFTLFFGAVNVSACECMERPTIDEEQAASAHAVILVLRSADNERAVLSVGMVLRGDLKENDELVFEQSRGKDCKWWFDNKDAGALFFFYLPKRPESGVWQSSTCSNSMRIKDAKEKDLDFLRKNRKSAPAKFLLTDEPRPAAKPRDGR